MFYRLLLLLVLSSNALSQSYKKTSSNESLYGISLSYVNQSGNFGKIGGFYETVLADNFIIKLDFNANLTGMRNQFSIIPEFGATVYYLESNTMILGTFLETELTPYSVTPKTGITLFTVMDFGVGYGFDIHQKENFKPIKGFQFSFGLNIPLNFNIY